MQIQKYAVDKVGFNLKCIKWAHRSGAKHVVPDGLTRAFDVPSNVVYGKGDVIDSLCSVATCEGCHSASYRGWDGIDEILCPMHIKDMGERETYSLPDRENLIEEQKKDNDLTFLREEFFALSKADQEALVSKKEGFFVRDDILFRRVEAKQEYAFEEQLFMKYHIQICVPNTMRRAVLYSVHGLPISGHDGQQRSRVRLEQNFWWPTYKKDIGAWVKSCMYCQKRKTLKPSRSGLTGSLSTEKPFQIVGFDILKLTQSDRGNNYLLTVIDHFSRYPLAIPIRDRSMPTVVQALFSNLVCIFGMPTVLLSDMEKSFVSEVTQGLLAKLGIRKVNTTGYSPTGNSVVERFHRFLNASLTMFVNKKGTDWEDYVDSVLFAYRTSMCTSTGFSPFELIFGRKAVLPPDLVYTVDGKQIQEEFKRGISVSDSIREAYRMTRERQARVALQNKSRRDKGRKHVEFQSGDGVFIYDEAYDKAKPGKLQFLFSGPHVVIRQGISPNIYWVQRSDKKTPQQVNVNRLVIANVYNFDLGEPLGAHDFSPDLDVEDEQKEGEGEEEEPTLRLLPKEGDIIVVDVSEEFVEKQSDEWDEMEEDTENLDGRPFSVGRVLKIEGAQLQLHWLGSYTSKDFRGVWRHTYVDSRDNKRVHEKASRKKPYTNLVSGHRVTLYNMIGNPFQLEDEKLPPEVVALLERRAATK